MRVPVRSSLTSALVVAALVTPLGAQGNRSVVPSRIAIALAGCWEPATGDLTGPMTCIVPESDASVLRVVSLGLGRESVESRLRLDGEQWPIAAGGCSGWQQAQVSSDGERILIAGEMRCGTLPAQRRSAMFLITPRAEWLRAEGRGIASVGTAQIQLMRPAASFSGMTPELRDAVGPLVAEAEQERARLQRARITSGDLIELETRGAATSIIDVVVAAGNPQAFAVSTATEPIVAVAPTEDAEQNSPMRSSYGFPYSGYNDLSYLSSCSLFSYGVFFEPRMCSPYSYSSYRYWGGYGGWWPDYYPSGGVVVLGPVERPQSGGQVVRGQGYRNTRSASTTRNATPRSVSPSSRTGASRGTSVSSGSSGSTSSSSGSSSSGGARTAKPRSP